MKLLLFFLLLVAFGCASTSEVRPGTNGIHRVIIRGEDKEMTDEAALEQARAFCSQQDKVMKVIKNLPSINDKKSKKLVTTFKEGEAIVSDISFECK